MLQQGRLREDWEAEFEKILPDFHKCAACQAVSEIEAEAINDFVHEHKGVQPDSDVDSLVFASGTWRRFFAGLPRRISGAGSCRIPRSS